MAVVDFAEDSKRRFVVCRYAYDPARNERRHIVVAVVDNQTEFEQLIAQLSDDLERRQATGEKTDPREHISGHVMEPGHLVRAANGHLIRRALDHGVRPDQLQSLELPIGMALFRVIESPRQ